MKQAPYRNFKINLQEKLIMHTFVGEVDVEDIIESMQKTVEEQAFDQTFNFLIDFRYSTFNTKEDNIDKTMHFLNKVPQLLSLKKVAVLTNTPLQVATTTLFSVEVSSFSVKPRIFTTLHSAHHFLDIKKDIKAFEQEIDNLRNLT